MPFQSINVMPVLPKPHNGLPRGPQLSAPEDKEMKKKLRNRESALAARERKKKKMLGKIYIGIILRAPPSISSPIIA